MSHPITGHDNLDSFYEATDGLSCDQQDRFDRRLIGILAGKVDPDEWAEALRQAARSAA